MRAWNTPIWLISILATLAGVRVVAATETQVPQLTPLVADVLAAPHAVLGSDGRTHLVYEIRIANITDGKVTLGHVAVLADLDGKPLAELDADKIGTRLSLGGRRGAEQNDLGPSQFAVLFIHVPLAAGAPVPAGLVHVLEGHADKPGADFVMQAARTAVISAEPPALGPPLNGKGYIAGDGCCDSIRHVRALLALDGTFYLAQRFAIDWERVDDAGRIFVGDAKNVRSYHIYGAPVLAVADARVVATRNDLADQVPGALPEGLPIDEADGNYVILDIGGAAYAIYAHMEPGSVAVKTGDRVRRGETIGRVGNTGNSQAPHLHFQLTDGPATLASNGLPYVFDAYAVTAVDETGTADFDAAEATGTPLALVPRVPPVRLEKSLPLDLSIVDWLN